MVVVEITRGSWVLNDLKIEPMGLTDRLNARRGRRKVIKNVSKAFYLSSWKNGVSNCHEEAWEVCSWCGDSILKILSLRYPRGDVEWREIPVERS